jgi:hypothetical protein
MTITIPGYLLSVNAGFQPGDIQDLMLAATNWNAAATTYGIAAVGSSQNTATQLKSVFNQIDINSSGGVNLPLSTGRRNTAYRFCVVINNTASAVTVYGYPGSSDQISNTSGATGVSQSANTTSIYISAKPNLWYGITASGGGGGGGLQILNGRIVTTTTVNMTTSDSIVEVQSPSNNVTVNLPSSPVNFQVQTVKDGSGSSATFPITLVPASGTIDGMGSFELNSNWESISYYYNGTNFRIL